MSLTVFILLHLRRMPSFIATTVPYVDLAILTFPFEIENFSALSTSNLPARPLPILIGYAAGVNVFRAPHKIPAGGFPTPKICHFPPAST